MVDQPESYSAGSSSDAAHTSKNYHSGSYNDGSSSDSVHSSMGDQRGSYSEASSSDAAYTAGTSTQVQKRGRGPTRCLFLHSLPPGEKISVEIDSKIGGPVGSNASKLTNYCGTLARNGHLFPLHHQSWRDVEEIAKERAWQRVQLKFDVPPTLRRFIMQSLNKKWRDYKSDLKRKHYDACTTDEERYAARPAKVDMTQWKSLVHFWNSEQGQKRSQTNRNNRSHQKLLHTSGTKSFARRYHEKKLKSSGQTSPTRAEIFIDTHVHKDGTPINTDVADKIQRMKEIMGQQMEGSQESTGRDDVYSQVMGPERHGRVRGYGLGTTPTKIWGSPARPFGPSNDASVVATLRDKVRSLDENMQQLVQEQVQQQVQQHMHQVVDEMKRLTSMVETLSKQFGQTAPPNDAVGPS